MEKKTLGLFLKRSGEQRKADIRRAALTCVAFAVIAISMYLLAMLLGSKPQWQPNQWLALLICMIAAWGLVIAVIDLLVTLIVGRNHLISAIAAILLISAFFKWFV